MPSAELLHVRTLRSVALFSDFFRSNRIARVKTMASWALRLSSLRAAGEPPPVAEARHGSRGGAGFQIRAPAKNVRQEEHPEKLDSVHAGRKLREKTGRQARLIELEPRYVDGTIKRWEALTGRRAERIFREKVPPRIKELRAKIH